MKTIRASIVFDFYPDEDNLMNDMTVEELLDYARETMAEDLIQMSYGSGADLINAIEVEIIND